MVKVDLLRGCFMLSLSLQHGWGSFGKFLEVEGGQYAQNNSLSSGEYPFRSSTWPQILVPLNSWPVAYCSDNWIMTIHYVSPHHKWAQACRITFLHAAVQRCLRIRVPETTFINSLLLLLTLYKLAWKRSHLGTGTKFLLLLLYPFLPYTGSLSTTPTRTDN